MSSARSRDKKTKGNMSIQNPFAFLYISKKLLDTGIFKNAVYNRRKIKNTQGYIQQNI